ncbi:MAG: SDR family NAD(P)-dependent oxidoreductase [Pseudomonadota bacterium]
MIRFDGRVAIITGAGKGLGRAYALDLAARGAKLVLNNRRREVDAEGLTAVDHVVREIRAGGGEAVANYASVEDPASGRDMVQQALDTWGRLDVVVNNAGIDRARSFGKFDMKDFLEILEVNFHGSLYVTHAAWNVMRDAGYGRVLVSASSAGLHGGAGLSAYAAAKGALIAFMRTLATEGRSKNVLANAISPYAATPMTGDHIAGALREALAPERVAPMVAFLASEQNQSVTGQTFVAAGGRFLRAATVEGQGLVYAGADLSAEAIARDIESIQSLDGAREFSDAVTAYRDFVAPVVGDAA